MAREIKATLNPAATIIRLLDGHESVADICGVHPHTAYRWALPRAAGGTGGIVPAKHQDALIGELTRRGKVSDYIAVITDGHEAAA